VQNTEYRVMGEDEIEIKRFKKQTRLSRRWSQGEACEE
jgi:hypothetical protein